MNPFDTMPRPPLALAAVAIALIVAAACGGGESDGGRGASGAANSPTQSASTASTPEADQGVEDGAGTSAAETAGVAESASESPGASSVEESSPEPEPDDGRSVGGAVGDRAPEFQKISNWINSDPLTMDGLRGNVVLIDIWTYTCVNCIRTLPFLKEWHAKYADHGLTIVGVHSPEFEFEKLTENVVRSTKEYDLGWPIAQDNDFGTWRAYNNRFWPAKYLVDKDGIVRYTHFGEGAYIETEEKIRNLLEEAGADLSDIGAGAIPDPQADTRAYATDPASRITREIYGGFNRNSSPQGIYVAHQEYYNGADQTLVYDDPGDHQNQFIYLQGPWTNGAEKLHHARVTENYEDYIALKFFATSVNAVIDPEGGDPFEVQVTIDGRSLLPEETGADVMVVDGRSFFKVNEARLYEVVALPDFGGHELMLSSNSPDFALFAFTFGAYSTGP